MLILLEVVWEFISSYVLFIILAPLVLLGVSLLIMPFESIGGKINKKAEELTIGKPRLKKAYSFVASLTIIIWVIGMIVFLEILF